MSNLVFPQFRGQTPAVKRTGPIYDVAVKRSRSKVEQRTAYVGLPYFRWELVLNFLRDNSTISIVDTSNVTQFTGTEIDALMWFIDQHKGQWDDFLFNDPRSIQRGTSLAVPSGLSGATVGGTLPAATYYYRVAALSSVFGETAPSLELNYGLGSTGGVQVSWGAVSGANGYKVYGRTQNTEQLIASVAAGVTSYTDSGALTPYGYPAQFRARFDMDAVDLDQVSNFVGIWGARTIKLVSVKS